MEFGTLMTSVFFHRGLLLRAILLHLIAVLSFFPIAGCGPGSTNGMQQQVGCDTVDPHRDGSDAGFEYIYCADGSLGYYRANSLTSLTLDNVCRNSHFFRFPSSFQGSELPVRSFLFCSRTGKSNLSSEYGGMFELSSGKTVSCSLKFGEGIRKMPSIWTRGTIQNEKGPGPTRNGKSRMVGLRSVDGSSSDVEITPPILDWGQKYMYSPSVAYLTVTNKCNHSVLQVYEPFSTSMQFYSCNDSELSLGPGEVASICFVFLGNLLGLSSGHIILQTSSGGFFVQAKGFSIESPYGLQPLVGLDVSFSRLSKNLSLSNPYDETLYVEEVTVWMVSSGNTSSTSAATCSVQSFYNTDEHRLLSSKDWLDVRSIQFDSPLMSMRPHGNWEIGPHSSETAIEIDFIFNSVGKLYGVVCVHLLRSSQDKTDVVMIPLEAEFRGKAACYDLSDSVSVLLEALESCDASGTVVFSVSLRNLSPYMLSVVKVVEVTESKKIFQIRYVEGLILFPGTVTKVAVVSSSQLPNFLSLAHGMDGDCRLHIMTNGSINLQIMIPCQDIVHSILKYQHNSSGGHVYKRIGCFGSNGLQPPSETKGLEMAEAEEMVLGNWKSQGKVSGMTVLDDHEVLFPMVQVGSHCSKWITVKNPSKQPVVMQLILNSGEIIDGCRGADGHVQPSLSTGVVRSESTVPSRYGFSIPKSSLTEVSVHPYSRAYIGPVIFHPSNRCGWRSSALIRNNLSGVEWLTLQGFGGLLSLVLHEGSEAIHRLEFNLNMPIPLNVSPPGMIFSRENSAISCSQPLMKELYAKNTGDLPLEVRKIEVSGANCRLDGFLIHSCNAFTLEPGESKKLLVSYQADFTRAIVRRDLELALTSGMLVIPMKATLPFYMLNLCGKSVFWTRVEKSSLAFILFVTSLMFCSLLPQVMGLCSQDDLFHRGKSSLALARDAGKSSHVHCIVQNSNASVSNQMDGLWSSCWDIKSSNSESASGNSACQNGNSKQGLTGQYLKPSLDYHGQMNGWSDTLSGRDLSSPLLSKPEGIESYEVPEATTQPSNLIVRITKGKRRRRKRKGAGAGLSGLFDASSSQSGNSTPSSPLSPVTSTPKQTGPLSPNKDQSIDARNPFSKLANRNCEKGRAFEPLSKVNKLEPRLTNKSSNNFSLPTQEQPSAPRISGKIIATSSDTFSCASRPAPQVSSPAPFLAPSSSIASYARAPGSKFCNQKTLAEERPTRENEFTYDIWGDHFFGLHLDRARELSTMVSSATESNSDSFFVRGPQAIGTKTQLRSVSYNQEA